MSLSRIPEFLLERWLRFQEPRAKYAIGGSGVARGNLEPFLPKTSREWSELAGAAPMEARERLRSAVAREYGVASSEVLPTSGASEADFLATLGLAGPRAHVLVEEPGYFALLQPPLAIGCRVERVARRPTDSYRLNPSTVEERIRSDTKLILLARPNNPTGARDPDDDLRAIAEAAERVGAWVLVDEVFAEATDGGEGPARRIHDRILSVNSLTKCLGFSALRTGWILAPPDVVETIDRAKSLVNPLNPVVDSLLAERVLADRRRLLERTRSIRRANGETLRRFGETHPDFDTFIPGHGTTTVVRAPAGAPHHGDDVAFATALLAERGALVAPGSYIEMPGFFRVGLAGDPDTLGTGLNELASFARGDGPR